MSVVLDSLPYDLLSNRATTKRIRPGEMTMQKLGLEFDNLVERAILGTEERPAYTRASSALVLVVADSGRGQDAAGGIVGMGTLSPRHSESNEYIAALVNVSVRASAQFSQILPRQEIPEELDSWTTGESGALADPDGQQDKPDTLLRRI
jgi:hypothetical protein